MSDRLGSLLQETFHVSPFYYSGSQDLFSQFKELGSGETSDGAAEGPTKEGIVLTSYLPTFERGPFGGIERLKALRVAGTTDPAVILSFHSLGASTALPENGILLEEGCSYIRLPSNLRELIPAARQTPLSEDGLRQVVLRSCTITGQLTMFLDRLVGDLQGRNTMDALTQKRLKGLIGFCRKHYDGWFQSELRVLQRSPQEDASISIRNLLITMRSLVGTASVSVQLARLEHGRSFDIVDSGLGPLRVMALNAKLGRVSMGEFAQVLQSDPKVNEFIGRLRHTGNEFSAAVEVAGHLSSPLETGLKRLVGAIAELSTFSFAPGLINRAGQLISAIDVLQDALADVKRYLRQV